MFIFLTSPKPLSSNFWALNCVVNFTGSNLFEPELDLNLWSSPRFRHLPELNHRSSSRFTEILKEPDQTRLRQHYIHYESQPEAGVAGPACHVLLIVQDRLVTTANFFGVWCEYYTVHGQGQARFFVAWPGPHRVKGQARSIGLTWPDPGLTRPCLRA